MTSPDSLGDFTDGDVAAADQLRRALRLLRDQHAGTPLARQVDEVLTGRLDLRTLGEDPEFATLVRQGMDTFAQQWAAASTEERTALVREGEAFAAAAEAELRRTH